MKARRPSRWLMLAGAVLTVAALVQALGARASRAPEPLLLTGARILDVRAGRYLPTAAVLVVGDLIETVAAEIPATLPANTRRIDLQGATLVPGLGDMFASASPDGSADADFYYAMALAHGVTQYRVVGAKLPWAASQRGRVQSGDILAPRLTVGGPRLEQRTLSSFDVVTVTDAQAARRVVAQQASLGAEWVAAGASTGADVLRALVRSARAGKLRISGEPGATSAADLIRIGVDAVDRVGFFGRSAADIERELASRPGYPADDPEAAADYLWQFASAADVRAVVPRTATPVTVIPMLASFNGVLDAEDLKADPAVAYLPAKWREALFARAHAAGWPRAAAAARAADVRARVVKALWAAGARLATGVDTGSTGFSVPGAAVHRELALLVKAGLSPADALRAATVNCAEMLGVAANLGEVKTGFKADLFAVDGDPLANIADLRRVRIVVRGGEALNPGELLAQARRATR
jgi:hypothetical protein